MRAPSCFSRGLLVSALLSASAFALEVGDAWEGPPPELGKPLGRLVAGEKTLFRWPQLEVTVAGGRVVQLKRLDAASVAADAEGRSKANAVEHARLLTERKERARAEALAKEKEAAEAAREAKLVAERAERAQIEEAARRKAENEARFREAELATRQAREKADNEERAAAARKAADGAAKEAEARDRERAKVAAEARAKDAARAKAEAAEPSASGAGLSLVKPGADPVAKLEREVVFLELDLKRAEAGVDVGDRARAAQLRVMLKEKRAQLDALKKTR